MFRQARIGKDGKTIRMFKFRSMVPNADEILKDLLEKNPDMALEYKTNKKLKNDPRITKMGKYVRKFSIDETPQFINILLGHMAMIGNRPYLPREKKDMGKYYAEIVMSKPGLTGYWQTAGRNNVDFNSRLKLESYYSKHMSLWFDIKIFFKTFGVVLFGRGAN
jgi:undecaprenyl-phosphate galactose phosphotransferase